jgi:hypothetical protein
MYYLNILLGYFRAKTSTKDILKPTAGYKSLHEISNDTGIEVAGVATFINVIVDRTVFPHRNIHKFIWKSSDWKTHNQTDRRQPSTIFGVRLPGEPAVIQVTIS